MTKVAHQIQVTEQVFVTSLITIDLYSAYRVVATGKNGSCGRRNRQVGELNGQEGPFCHNCVCVGQQWELSQGQPVGLAADIHSHTTGSQWLHMEGTGRMGGPSCVCFLSQDNRPRTAAVGVSHLCGNGRWPHTLWGMPGFNDGV